MTTEKALTYLIYAAVGIWLARRDIKRRRAGSTRTEDSVREALRWYFWPDIQNEADAQRMANLAKFVAFAAAIFAIIDPATRLWSGEIGSTDYDTLIFSASMASYFTALGFLSWKGKLWPQPIISLTIMLWIIYVNAEPIIRGEAVRGLNLLFDAWILKVSIELFRNGVWLLRKSRSTASP